MRLRSNIYTALMGSVCAAALSWSSTAGAEPVVRNISEIDYTLDLDLDYIAFSLNKIMSEGALGASNMQLEQTALAQLGNAAGRIGAGNFLAIDQEQLTGSTYEYGDIAQVAINLAASATTRLDAKLGGNQVAVSSFNTAAFDVAGETGTGTIALVQSLVDGDQNYNNAEVSVNLIAGNFMDAAATYAGTAVIDAEMANPDYLDEAARADVDGYDTLTPETINGLQQAAVSMNTLRGTADDGTTAQIDLFGQNLDTTALYDPENSYMDTFDTRFAASASNQAIAYSPRPADTRYVAPELVNGLNDPKVANLDQVAAISLNTISLGVEDGTADFVIYAQNESNDSLLSSNGSGDEWGAAQVATFTDSDSDYSYGYYGVNNRELFLSNTMVATTNESAYDDYSVYADGDSDIDSLLSIGANSEAYVSNYQNDYDFYDDAIGNVALEDVSQVAALTVNSISQAGTGDLTLKAGYSENDVVFGPADFVQTITGFELNADDYDYVFDGSDFDATYAINYAQAETAEGNVNVDTVAQTLQLGLNGISTKGDLIGWNADDGAAIVQDADVSIDLANGNEVEVYQDTNEDNATIDVTTIDQLFNLSLNTVSVAGDMTANLDQYGTDALYWNSNGDLNQVDVDADEDGSVNVDDISQFASLRLNAVNVTGNIDSNELVQDLYLGDVEFNAGVNEFDADVEDGNITVDGVDQIAMLNLNSISGADITAGATQTASDLSYYDDYSYGPDDTYYDSNVNEIFVDAQDTGNAALSNGSQISVLNINTVAASGVLSGSVYQDSANNQAGTVASLYTASGSDAYTNYANVYADQDLDGVRNVGGNATLDGMSQTASYNVNTVSAASLSDAYIGQTLINTSSFQSNFAGIDAEYGVASATGAVQTAINRANYMSISTPVVPSVVPTNN